MNSCATDKEAAPPADLAGLAGKTQPSETGGKSVVI